MTPAAARLLAALLWLSFCPAGAFAAAVNDYPPPWPAKDITVTVPFSKGSEADTLFSLIRETFVVKTGKNAEARYFPGRAGADAWSRMVDDAADGSVLTLVTFPDAYLRSTVPDSGVFPEAMSVCSVIAYMPCVLWSAGKKPFSALREMTDAAAERQGGFLVAGSGSYSAAQLAARALDRETGVRTTYLPYRGTTTAARAVLNGEAGAFWGFSVPVTGVDAATFKPLAVAMGKRIPSLPDVPAFEELGMSITEGVYIGIAVPAETPEITCAEISEYFSSFANSLEFKEKAEKAGFFPLNIALESMPVFFTDMKADAERKAESFSLGEQ